MISATKNMYKQCETCKEKVQSFCISMQCVNCCNYYHANCVNIKREAVQNNESWYCWYCFQSMFPFNHMDDDDFYSAVLEGLLNFPFDFHEMNNTVFIPFEINESIHPAHWNGSWYPVLLKFPIYSWSKMWLLFRRSIYFKGGWKNTMKSIIFLPLKC